MRYLSVFSFNKIFIVLMGTFLLAACGGGGTDTSGGNSSGGTTTTNTAGQVDFSTQSESKNTSVAKYAFDMGVRGSSLTENLSITGKPVQAACTNGGSYDIPAVLDPGYGTYTFVNCKFLGVVLDGQAIKIVSSIASFDTQYTFNTFSILAKSTTLTIDGTLFEASSISAGIETGKYSNNGGVLTVKVVSPSINDTVTLTDFSESHVDDTNNGQLTYDFKYTVSSTKLGGSVTLKTTTTIKYNYNLDSYPYAGVFEVTGKQGGNVRITILGDGSVSGLVRVEIDADGNGTYETSKDITWAAFAASV